MIANPPKLPLLAKHTRPGVVARLVTVAEANADPGRGLTVPDSADERLAAVWEVSCQLLLFAGYDESQLRLRRSVCSVQRR